MADEELRDRVARMECTVSDLDKRASIQDVIIEKIRDDIRKGDESTKKLIEVLDAFSKTVQKLELTLVSMDNKIDNNESKVSSIANKIDKIEKKIEEADDKSKIDIRDIFKGAYGKVLLLLVGGGIMAVILNWTSLTSFIK